MASEKKDDKNVVFDSEKSFEKYSGIFMEGVNPKLLGPLWLDRGCLHSHLL